MADADDPVPLGYRFDIVWRGYHRRQVDEYIELALRYLTADRDAAIAMVCKLTRLLEQSRSQARRLRERYDRLCRVPLSPDAVAERLRRQIEALPGRPLPRRHPGWVMSPARRACDGDRADDR